MSIDKITKQHVLSAIEKIEKEGILLEPSTKYNVVINGKIYPPKEVMRYANLLANGKKDWPFSGGEPTNKFLKEFGFEIQSKDHYVKEVATILRNAFPSIWRCADSWHWHELKDTNLFTFAWLDKNIDYINTDFSTLERGSRAIYPWVHELSVGDLIFVMGKNTFDGICVAESEYDYNGPFLNLSGHGEKPAIKVKYLFKLEEPVTHDLETHNNPTTFADIEKYSFGLENVIRFLLQNMPGAIDNVINFINHSENNNLTSISSFQHPVNTILYGPPGTGKTYCTINKTLSIIDGPENAKLSSRKEENARFNELLDNGIVKFISFHQSMSYEDFIEGIKPQTKSDKIHYSVRSGIFKSICYKALKSMYHANQPKSEELDLDVLYDEFVKYLQSTYKDNDYRFKSKEGSELRLDKEQLDKGRVVVYFRYSNSVKKEGEGKAPFTIKKEKIKKMFEEKVTDNEPNLTAKLKPILSYHLFPYYAVYKSFLEFVRNKVGENAAAYLKDESTSDDSDFERYLEQLQLLKKQGVKLKKGQPHVLIIDEINRGNVSQIFGELITLIEEDKRFGKGEALEVTLPYSQEKFVVPENLYIIGTMNTADRSVEALDTALRRRFSFEEKMPDLKELTTNVDGVNLQLLVGKINERLETLLDCDHTIGHAWLMECKNIGGLRDVFQNKIIPLLKEFFYNDYGKIGLILGDAFFEDGRSVKDTVFAPFKRVDSDIKRELAQKPVFHLRMPEGQDLVNAFQSIYSSVKANANAELN